MSFSNMRPWIRWKLSGSENTADVHVDGDEVAAVQDPISDVTCQ